MTAMKVLVAAGVLVTSVLCWGEWENRRASRRRLGVSPPEQGRRDAVVVLGYRDRGPRANAVNRWRVRAGLRSLRDTGTDARLVLCDGPTGCDRPEAELMADYARDERGYRESLLVETASRSTWENVRNAVPLIEDADRIRIVSHPLHAEKARAYLWLQRPDLATRLVRARDYRFGEWTLVKPALAWLGLSSLRRLDSASTTSDHPAS